MSERVTMKALDTMHISNVSSEPLQEGDVFYVSEAEAKHLEARGLAERGGSAAKAVNSEQIANDRADTRERLDEERGFKAGKAISAAPANKQVEVTANKSADKPAGKRK